MKVLHTYPTGDALTARYLSQLTEALRGRVECVLCDEKAEFRRLCEEWKPDIVHQHGDTTIAVPDSFRRVVTANGARPAAITGNSHDYYAVIARSQIEARRLKLPRCEVILNPLITKTTTFDAAAAKTLHVYQRVMDSNPLERLDADSRRLLAAALKVGLLGDRRWITHPSPSTLHPSPLTTSLRLLYIYADLEGVATIADEGLRLLNVEVPRRDALLSPKPLPYTPEGYKPPVSMRGRTIVEMVRDVSEGHLSLLRLADLFMGLYAPHLNEHELLAQLEYNGQKPLFQSLLQILYEQLLLDEGFMPCAPVDNQQTSRLRNLLTSHLSFTSPTR